MAEPVWIPSHGGWHRVLVDAQDVPGIYSLLDAGVTLRVWQDKQGKPRAILCERYPDGALVTLSMMKVLMGASPTEEVHCLNGDGLDCRRSNWRKVDTGIVRVWNSRLLGVKVARPSWTPPT